MKTDLIFPLLVNVLVGVYLVWFYPRSVRRNFPDGQIPRGFALLMKLMPLFGGALIVTSLIWGGLSLSGMV